MRPRNIVGWVVICLFVVATLAYAVQVRLALPKPQEFTFSNSASLSNSNEYTIAAIGNSLDIGVRAMTANNVPSPLIAYADSDLGGTPAQYDGHNCFDRNYDGSPTSSWNSALGTGGDGFVKLNLGAGGAKTFRWYSVWSTGSPLRAPKDFYIEAGNVDNTWQIIDTVTGQTGWGALEKRSFAIDNPGSFQFYRLRYTANDGDPEYDAIGEIDYYEGYSADGDTATSPCFGAGIANLSSLSLPTNEPVGTNIKVQLYISPNAASLCTDGSSYTGAWNSVSELNTVLAANSPAVGNTTSDAIGLSFQFNSDIYNGASLYIGAAANGVVSSGGGTGTQDVIFGM